MSKPKITSRVWWEKKVSRVSYYAAGVARELLPAVVYRHKLEAFYRSLDQSGIGNELLARINYYNKFDGPIEITEAIPLSRMELDQTYSYYDFRKFAHYFGRDARFRWHFGDVTFIPHTPAFVKSRPLSNGNENSIVMKLDSLRHFQWTNDELRFEDKRPQAVWRGILNNPRRKAVVERFADNPGHNIGHCDHDPSLPGRRPFISVSDQLTYKYVLSIEGNDVATNLKWVMSSNSLCMMPQPRFETWFMEGAIEPGVHYVLLRDDFSDLEDKIAYYEANPDEAQAIIAAAHAHTRIFRDDESERTVALLVMQKYLELTGQIPARYFAAR